MKIYFFTAGLESEELKALESRISAILPALQQISKLDELSDRTIDGTIAVDEQTYVIFPILNQPGSLERIVSIAEKYRGGHFFIFVSAEISASEYKRLTRTGRADWVSIQRAPVEIREIVSRLRVAADVRAASVESRPAIAAFVPSSGGVGNATLAIEAAVQLKSAKPRRERRICLLDLDLQSSHVCDYLDIEPRLQFQEIAEAPARLDAQLFDLSVSRHTSGLDVLAAPRNKLANTAIDLAALDALFRMISQRYDLLLLDLPPYWLPWTAQVLSACDLALVTGFNTIPSLRQVSETVRAVRELERAPPQIAVALNRCEADLLGRIARSQHVKRLLGSENVLFIRDDPAAAIYSANTGIPLAAGGRSNKITKDIKVLVSLLDALEPGSPPALKAAADALNAPSN